MTLRELKKKGRLVDCEQYSNEWWEVRKGKVTASEFSSATSRGQGKTRMNYMYKLLAERLTGEVDRNGYTNRFMEWGLEQEQKARLNYEFETGIEITQVGFISLDDNIGASPDGLIGDDGLIQIKCPASHTHVSYLISNKVPAEYMKQIQGELWVTGRKWSDFVSYDPRNRYNDFLRIRVYREEEFIALLRDDIYEFVREMLDYERILKKAML